MLLRILVSLSLIAMAALCVKLNSPASLHLLGRFDTVIILHMPKTGGTSLRTTLQRYIKIYHLNYPQQEHISMQVFYTNRINTFNGKTIPRIVYGHNARYPHFHHSYLEPHKHSFIYISVIRSPLERAFSHFKYWKAAGMQADQTFNGFRNRCKYSLHDRFLGSFHDFLRCFPDMGCYQWKMVTGMYDLNCTSPYHRLMSDEEVIERGKEIIDKHYVLLPLEAEHKMLQYLVCALDLCDVRLPSNSTDISEGVRLSHINSASPVFQDQLLPTELKRYKKISKLDTWLHNYAQDILDKANMTGCCPAYVEAEGTTSNDHQPSNR